jgi:hypothetical protein
MGGKASTTKRKTRLFRIHPTVTNNTNHYTKCIKKLKRFETALNFAK